MKTKEIAIKTSGLKQYSIDKPAEMVAMATVLKGHIVKHGLYTNISNKNYVMVEGWEFAGFLLGIYPRVEGVENMSSGQEMKWRANVNLYKNDKVVSSGIAVCSNKENKKKTFDEYAILSMAQTRAIGKAYRNLIGWVMKLAGYEGTPSEEMKKVGETVESATPAQTHTTEAPRGPNKASTAVFRCSKCAKVITDAEAEYSQKVYKKILCRDCQKTK